MNTAAMSLVYEDVLPVINSTVGGFVRRYGGDFDELRAQADLIFVEQAALHADATLAGTTTITLETWLRYTVWNKLLDGLRQIYAQKRRPTGGWVSMDDVGTQVAAPTQDDVTERLGYGLSDDAQAVIQLAIDTPAPLQTQIVKRGGTPRNHLSVYRAYLVSQGWDSDRVTRAFDEVRNSGKSRT